MTLAKSKHYTLLQIDDDDYYLLKIVGMHPDRPVGLSQQTPFNRHVLYE